MANKYALIHAIMYIATRNAVDVFATVENINKLVIAYGNRHGMTATARTALNDAIINYYF